MPNLRRGTTIPTWTFFIRPFRTASQGALCHCNWQSSWDIPMQLTNSSLCRVDLQRMETMHWQLASHVCLVHIGGLARPEEDVKANISNSIQLSKWHGRAARSRSKCGHEMPAGSTRMRSMRSTRCEMKMSRWDEVCRLDGKWGSSRSRWKGCVRPQHKCHRCLFWSFSHAFCELTHVVLPFKTPC